jgi:hypothetical protein
MSTEYSYCIHRHKHAFNIFKKRFNMSRRKRKIAFHIAYQWALPMADITSELQVPQLMYWHGKTLIL